MLPTIVMPPSVPAGTCFQVVIIRAREPRYCPISLATVSVAASARAASRGDQPRPVPRCAISGRTQRAAVRFARICHAVRLPCARLAQRQFALISSRVVAQVIANRSRERGKGGRSNPREQQEKQAKPPATAPNRLAPRKARASMGNATVHNRGDAQQFSATKPSRGLRKSQTCSMPAITISCQPSAFSSQ